MGSVIRCCHMALIIAMWVLIDESLSLVAKKCIHRKEHRHICSKRTHQTITESSDLRVCMLCGIQSSSFGVVPKDKDVVILYPEVITNLCMNMLVEVLRDDLDVCLSQFSCRR